MEYINSTLGIPVKGLFHDHVSGRFANASGSITSRRNKNKSTWAKLGLVTYAAGLIGDKKKRAVEVMGSASNPERAKMEHYLKDIIGPKYPYSKDMPSQTLEGIVNALNKEYDYMNSRLPELVHIVANNSKKFSVEPNRSTIYQIQDVRAMMTVINDYRADVIKAYDRAFERESKEANEPKPTSGPSPMGSSSQGTPNSGTVVDGVGAGVSEMADKAKDVAKKEVSVAGKKIPVGLILGGIAGVAIVWYFIKSR